MLIHANYQDFQRYVGVDSWIAGEAQASLPALTATVRRGMTAAHRKAAAERTARFAADRSEEHTSELQSLMRISYAVLFFSKKSNRCHSVSIKTKTELMYEEKSL